jgi:hypothetical protein
MSGGFFDYKQYDLEYIADAIETIIAKSGKTKMPEDMYSWEEEGSLYPTYSPKEIQKFQEAVVAIRIARVYAHRVDWLVSGDDGEESFFTRLEEDLKEVRDKYTQEYFDKLKKMSFEDYNNGQ